MLLILNKILIIVALNIINFKFSFEICIDQTCDSLYDIPSENVKLHWTYVHFGSWFPVQQQYLSSNLFTNHNQLEYITFKRMLNGTDKNALKGLDNLQTIVFQNNILESLPKELFQNCPKLEKIVIKNCKMRNILSGTFENLEELQHLKIEENKLHEITKYIFPKQLVELILRDNEITYIEGDVFYDMNKLQILDLSENYLTIFEFKKYLLQTPRLHEIKIGGNYLENLSKLPRLTKLKYFYIENNSITTMDANIFENTPKIETINLSDNNLKSLTTNNFATYSLKHLKKIYLSYNNLNCIDLELLKLFPNLKIIWIGMNSIKCDCYTDLENYLIKNGIISLYNYDIEFEKYNICKNISTIQLLQ